MARKPFLRALLGSTALLWSCAIASSAMATDITDDEHVAALLRQSLSDEEGSETSALSITDPGQLRGGADAIVRKPTPSAPAPGSNTAPTPTAAANTNGSGVAIGIVDTGVDYRHPEFAGRYLSASTCFGACPNAYTRSGGDDNSHGTHVAGIAAGKTVGVAKGATILSVKALDANGSGSYSDIASAIRSATSSGAKVINMSLGGPSPWSGLQSALQFAAPTSVIVAAAGNSGNNKTPSYPAAYAATTGIRGSMIIVGAVDSNNRIAYFSQTPGNACTGTFCLRDYFVVAPGVSIYSSVPNGGYARYSGTSMATPFVAGLAALVKGQSSFLTPQQVVDIILRTATDLGVKGTDNVYGRGRVNVTAAMGPVGATSTPTGGGLTASFWGTGEVRGSSSSGVLSAGLTSSSLLSHVVLLDEYGRDYEMDLASAASQGGLSLEGLIGDPMLETTPLALAMEGLSVSALLIEDTTPAIAEWNFAVEDTDEKEVRDLFITANLTEEVSASFGSSASLAGRTNDFDLAASPAFTGLFLDPSSFNSPFASVADGGDFFGVVTKTSDSFRTRLSYTRFDEEETESDPVFFELPDYMAYAPTAKETLRSAETIAMSANWDVAPWFGVGFSATHVEENLALLGGEDRGALSLVSDATTNAAGLSARIGLGQRWFAAASANFGTTEATPLPGSLVTNFSTLTSAAYGIAFSKQGVLHDDDTIGFAISRPLHLVRGTGSLTAALEVTEETREILYGSEVLSFASETPQTDLEAGYTNWLADGLLSLQLNAAYQMDVNGQPGEDAVAAMTRLKLKL